MPTKGVSGLGVTFMAAGGIIAWSAINNVGVIEALRALAKGDPIPSNRKPPFEPVQLEIAAGAVMGATAPATGNAILAMAAAVANSPAGKSRYCWGGGHTANPCGARCYDCSGYASCVLNRLGVLKGSKTTVGFMAWDGLRRVAWNDRQPGDLLINGDHMGIMIDATTMWNAACTACGPVKVSKYTGKRYGAYRLARGGSDVATATGVIQGG